MLQAGCCRGKEIVVEGGKGRVTPAKLGGWRGLLRVEASIAVDGGEEGRELGLGVERRRGRDHGHPGR